MARGNYFANECQTGVRVLNVEEKLDERSEDSTDPRAIVLEEEVDRIEARLAGLAAGNEFLQAIRPTGAIEQRAPIDHATLQERHAFLVRTIAANTEESDGLRRLLEEAKLARKRLDVELRRTAESGPRRSALVNLRADAAVRVELVLDCAVNGATWYPDYDVQVAEDFASIRVEYFGIVSQSTGEDWRGAAIALATARPSEDFVRRDVSPWTVVSPPPAQPMPLKKTESSSIRVIDTQEQTKIRAIGTTEEAIATFAGGSSWTARFEIHERIDLPSDGSSRRVRIANVPLASRVRHEVAPTLGEHAFLVAETRNESPSPFLRGRTHVTLAGAYLGRGRMDEIAPGQEFTLALGEDPYVSVERNVLERSEKVRSENAWKTSRDRIEIVNRHAHAIDVVMRDRIPVSLDRDVHVKVIEIEPRIEPGEDGILEWELPVGAGETRRAEVAYEVRYPVGRRPRNL